MAKIRIGFYIDEDGIGGAENYMNQIIKYISADVCEAILFCKREYPIKEAFGNNINFKIEYINNEKVILESKNLKSKDIRIKSGFSRLLKNLWHKIPLKSLKYLVGNIEDIVKMMFILKRFNLDIFHSKGGGSDFIVIAARLAGVPIIVASYCVLPDSPNIKKPNRNTRRVLEWISFNCLDKAIVKTQATQNMWVDYFKFNPKKFVVIPNGIDLYLFNTEPDAIKIKQELGIKVDAPVVGFSARLHPMKGHKYLLKAIPEIIKHIPNVQFLFAGDGDLKDELMEMVKDLRIEPYVKFLGYRNDLDKLTWVYDIAVLPSVAYETFGWVIIEAMACKKPVVASNFSGIPEVVEDGVTGILVPPRDPDKLTEAIIRLLQDEELRKKMGEAGRKRVEKYFTQDIMLEKTQRLYEKFLDIGNK